MRSTIHTKAVLLSIDQYMDMHQHFHNTPPLLKVAMNCESEKQRDYVKKNKIQYICQPQRFKQVLRFTHTYTNVVKVSLMTFSISDDAKLDLDF